MEPESRQSKDAVTVEIGFALMTATALGGVVFGALVVPALLAGVSGPAREDVLKTGTVLAVVAGVWRVTRVLRRCDVHRRRGLSSR